MTTDGVRPETFEKMVFKVSAIIIYERGDREGVCAARIACGQYPSYPRA